MDRKQILECQQNHKKMKPEHRICRLCFKRCGNFETIDDDIKEVLNVLLPKIDLAAILEPVMCTLCAEILFKSFDFKATCLNTHDYLFPFVNEKGDVKLNLKDIYITQINNNESVPEDEEICGFCMSPVKNCFAILLVAGERDIVLRKTEQCLPELDLSTIKEPVICASCHASLEKYFRFVTSVLIVEEKIKKYRVTLKMSSKSQLDLGRVFQFIIRDVDDCGDDKIKIEKMFCDRNESVEEVEYIDNTPMDINEPKFNYGQNFTPKNMLKCDIERKEIGTTKVKEQEEEFKKETHVDMNDQELLLHEEIKIKTEELDFNRCEEDIVVTQQTAIGKLNEKREYSVLPNFDDNLSNPHVEQTFTKKSGTKIGRYRRFLSENNYCLTKHNNTSEVTMHKCDSCVYQTRDKRGLQRHSLIHKDISEVPMYICGTCAFQTIHKGNLRTHLLRHKDFSKLTMYKCASCLYQTKYKPELRRHLLTHKSPSEVTMHKCGSCVYQTRHKRYLKRHSLIHKHISEVKMFKCDLCMYENKYKSLLKNHLLKHQRPSGSMIMYKCDLCLFNTRYKYNLKKHLLNHKNE